MFGVQCWLFDVCAPRLKFGASLEIGAFPIPHSALRTPHFVGASGMHTPKLYAPRPPPATLPSTPSIPLQNIFKTRPGLALKERNVTARGNAPGKNPPKIQALKGRNRLSAPFMPLRTARPQNPLPLTPGFSPVPNGPPPFPTASAVSRLVPLKSLETPENSPPF